MRKFGSKDKKQFIHMRNRVIFANNELIEINFARTSSKRFQVFLLWIVSFHILIDSLSNGPRQMSNSSGFYVTVTGEVAGAQVSTYYHSTLLGF